MSLYAVYLTTYLGNKLPMYYIGSSSVSKIDNGYHGTVTSKRHKTTWLAELKTNPHLFKTRIVRTYPTRKEAMEVEFRLQTSLGVVKSPMYVNMATASVNGFFGMSTKGRLVSEDTRSKLSKVHSGKTISQSHRSAITKKLAGRVSNRKGVKMPAEYGELQSKLRKGVPNLKNRGSVPSIEAREKMSVAGKGRKQSQEHTEKRTDSNKRTYEITFPCGKVEVILGLSGFCRQNNLSVSCLNDVVHGKQKSHRGFLAKKVEIVNLNFLGREILGFPLPIDNADQLSLAI